MEREQHQIWTPIYLTDGQDVAVDERIYPMLMEWEWEFDPKLGQAVRTDGSGVRLYDEQIRLLASTPVSMFPVLDRDAIRKQFAGLAEYGELLRLSQQQREPVLYKFGYYLPNATLFLASSLSAVLAAYYRWLAAPTRLIVRADPTNLTPGSFEEVREKRSYSTLGEWMCREVTGAWMPDSKGDSPTGLMPEVQMVEVMKIITKEWRTLLRASNFQQVKPKRVEAFLKWEDLPVWLLVQHAIEVIENYRV